MQKIWFTSDLHIGHKNILKYTERGNHFRNLQEHDEWIIDYWNQTVGDNDVVYHLGDFAFLDDREYLEVLGKLKGDKRFIKGNHDSSRVLKKAQQEGMITWYRDYFELKSKEHPKIIMCHFPFVIWNNSHHGSWHLHGHSHGSYQGQGKILDVGIDNAYNVFGEMRFLTLDDIQGFMDAREIAVHDHHGD